MNFKLLAFKRSRNKITVWIEQPNRQVYCKVVAIDCDMSKEEVAHLAIMHAYNCAVNEWLELQQADLHAVIEAIKHQQSYIAAGFNIPRGSKL